MNIVAIAGVITALSGAGVILWKVRKWIVNIIEGMKCQLRSDMLRTYYKNKDKKTIRQFELENFTMSYDAYRALGGNSFIEEVHSDVLKWEIVS